jgi:hypothetical protein
MSSLSARFASPLGSAHPVVFNRRVRELVLIGLSVLIPLSVALAISVRVSNPSVILLLAMSAGALGIVALVISPRYEATVVVLALYLGLLEGPVKLGSGAGQAGTALRDTLIFSIAIGAVLRILVKRDRVRLPPLTAWVLAWVAIVLVEAFNPNTHGLTKVLGGYKQQLEWVPFFFFGYALIRSKVRFRKLFLLLGVIALANGVVSIYQSRVGPAQLATWGPGYRELVYGGQEAGKVGGLSARTFAVEGVSMVRPPALGTDSGFGGGVGVIALPATLALLAATRMRRRWPIMLLSLGCLLAVVTGLGRSQVVGAVIAALSFAGLSLSAGRRVTKPIGAFLAVLALAIPAGAVLVTVQGGGTFSRYTSIAPENVVSSKDKKTQDLSHIPALLESQPFGVGLGSVGAAAGFGGKQTELFEGHGVSSETQYNFVADELGLPGLLLWVAFTIRLLVLALPGLARVPDLEVRLYLAALIASLIASTIMGLSGPTMSSAAFGPFFWFRAGILAYWFAGPGRSKRTKTSEVMA